MKKFTFSDAGMGGKVIVILDKDKLTISRPGIISKLYHGFVGEKTIFFKQITSVQLKEAKFGRGYIQFTLAGTPEKKAGMIFGDTSDENTIYFSSGLNNKKINSDAKEIKKCIENYISIHNENTNFKSEDKYDKLTKLKKLLDENIISQKEFDKEKEKLLNN